MYSLKIQIHPRIYNQEGPSESLGDFRKSEIIEQNKEEEANRKEFINSMIDIIGSKTNKKEALDTMNSLLGGKYSDLIRLDLETLKFHILSLFDNDGEKKENFPSRINEIKKAFGIKSIETLPEEEKRKFDEFKKKNPITAYKDEIFIFLIKNPRIADGTFESEKNLLAIKREELNKLGIGAMNEYEAVLATAEHITQESVFSRNTGSIKNFFAGEGKKLRMQIFQTALKDALNTAVEVKEPQDIEGFSNKEFKNLTIEDEQTLIEKSPDKMYDYFIVGLQGMLKENNLNKDTVDAYIRGLTGDIIPVLEKLGSNHPLRKIYENKITQIKALAKYDILYDSFSQFKGFFSGNDLKKFFTEAEKGKGEDGAIGYDKNGTFKFYSIYEMDREIMEIGEISGTCGTAWDNYIKASGEDFSKLQNIFGKDSFKALAIYFEKTPNSTLLDKNQKFGNHIKENYLPENYILNAEKYGETLEEFTLEKDFPRLKNIIQSKGLNTPKEIPKTADGGINTIALAFIIIEGNNTPGNIEAVKNAIDTDLENIKSKLKEKRNAITESLDDLKDWKTALQSLDIKYPLEGGSGGIKDPLTSEQGDALKKQLQQKQIEILKQDETPENVEKLKKIKKLLKLIDINGKIDDVSNNQSALQQINTNNIANASGNEGAEEVLAKATINNARAVNEQQKLDDFQKRNAEIIQNLSVKYNIPLDSTELANPQYLNQINFLIANLGKKEKLTPDEEIFLDYLQRTKGQIRLNSQSIIAHQELAKSYPEFKETLSNIRETNKVVYENLTSQKLEQYEHIARFIFPEDPVTEMKRDLANLPPGGTLDLVEYYSNNDIGNGMRSSISIEECSFTKNGANTGTINFPPYMGIPPMKGVPVHGIESFLSQADLLVRLGFRSLIPSLQDINTEVSKKYGKGTNSLDGSFDSYELRRTSTFLCEIIGIELTGNEAIPDITNKINARYSSDGDIRKRLKEMEILTEEGDFRKYQFQEIVKAMNKKTA